MATDSQDPIGSDCTKTLCCSRSQPDFPLNRLSWIWKSSDGICPKISQSRQCDLFDPLDQIPVLWFRNPCSRLKLGSVGLYCFFEEATSLHWHKEGGGRCVRIRVFCDSEQFDPSISLQLEFLRYKGLSRPAIHAEVKAVFRRSDQI